MDFVNDTPVSADEIRNFYKENIVFLIFMVDFHYSF
jgi:hypothetical protein